MQRQAQARLRWQARTHPRKGHLTSQDGHKCAGRRKNAHLGKSVQPMHLFPVTKPRKYRNPHRLRKPTPQRRFRCRKRRHWQHTPPPIDPPSSKPAAPPPAPQISMLQPAQLKSLTSPPLFQPSAQSMESIQRPRRHLHGRSRCQKKIRSCHPTRVTMCPQIQVTKRCPPLFQNRSHGSVLTHLANFRPRLNLLLHLPRPLRLMRAAVRAAAIKQPATPAKQDSAAGGDVHADIARPAKRRHLCS